MIGYPQEQRTLTRKQKEAVGLLSIGTFLEYFDLMLYVHMAVLLNELFFPKADPHTEAIYSAFAFCSTYLLRPFGALIFGWIGDNIGRKATVIITTFMMACSCFTIAILPTYVEIGLTATILITICRIFQGLSATAEGTGAEIYLMETSKPPMQYPLVSSVTLFSALGTTSALIIASLVTLPGFNWRYAFGFGLCIALIGVVARTSLRETTEFADARRNLKNMLHNSEVNIDKLKQHPIFLEKVSLKISISYFLIQCARPPCFYFIYIHCGNILRQYYGFTAEQVIHNNLIVSLIDLLGIFVLICLSYKIYPLKILKVKLVAFFTLMAITPFILTYSSNSTFVLVIQCIAAVFVFDHVPATPIFYKYFPVFKRFTYTSFIHATAGLTAYMIASFGLVYCVNLIGHWGILVIMAPAGCGFLFGVNYFQKLEDSNQYYTKNPTCNIQKEV